MYKKDVFKLFLNVISWSLSVTVASPAKMDEPVKMPFVFWAWVGPRNHVRWGPDPPWEEAILRGKSGPL